MGSFKTMIEGVAHEWEIKPIDYPFCIGLKSETGVDLLSPKGIYESGLFDSIEKQVDATWYSVAKQVQDAGITRDVFLASLMGDTFDDIAKAWIEAYLPFCRASARPRVRIAMEKAMQMRDTMEATVDALLTGGGSPGNTPESAESTSTSHTD